MKIAAAAIAAIASLAASSADAAEWRRVPVPGGTIEDLVVLADGRLYAGTTDGLYRSDDAGDYWARTELVPSYKRFRKVYPLDGTGNRLVAYTEVVGGYDSRALELSTNGGATWQVTLSEPSLWGTTGTFAGRFVSHPDNPDVVLFTEYQSVRRSEDGGQTWQTLDVGSNWSEIFAVPGAVGRFVAHSTGVNLQFLESTDGGLTWILRGLTPPLPRHGRAHVVQDALQPERLYFSFFQATIDGGRVSTSGWVDTLTWSVTLFSDPCDCHRRLVPDPHRPGRLLAPSTTIAPVTAAITGYPIRESLDGGATWHTLSSLERQIDTELRLVFDPSTPGRSYMPSLGAGVYRSDDDGTTWNLHHAGMTGGTLPEVSINPTDPDEFVVARRLLPMLYTNDGGVSFQTITADIYRELNSAHAQRIARSRSDSRLLVSYGGSSLYRSEDGGASWRPIVSDFPFDSSEPYSVHFVGTGTSHLVVAALDRESNRLTFLSNDGGEHWIPGPTPGPPTQFQSLQTHGDTDRYYLAYEFGSVNSDILYLASSGDGLPFVSVTPPSSSIGHGSSWAVSRPDPSNWKRRLLMEHNGTFGTEPDRIWETLDDGTSWTLLGSSGGTGFPWSIDACDGRTVWDPSAGLVSRDSGLTFHHDAGQGPLWQGRFDSFCLSGRTHAVAIAGETALGSGLMIREPEAGDTLFRHAFDR